MNQPPAGFREVEHTADWELEVWAPDFASLLEQSARGMYKLAGVRLLPEPRLTEELRLHAEDRESMLVDFLSELLFLGEVNHEGFDQYDLQLDDKVLSARLGGARIAEQAKEIKAVTYHKLKIEKTDAGLQVNIVFDV